MIPCNDLAPQHRSLKAPLAAIAERLIERSWFVLGEELAGFEREFAAYCGVGHGVGVASGTDAIELGLRALGVRNGDEVVTVAHTAVPTVAAIRAAGATPVLVDVEERTNTMDPAALESRLTPRTRAIVPVHLYGHPADLDPILALARPRRIVVLEDCAQAHGARYLGRRVGGLGDAAAFSFYPTKNLGALGDAGMIVTDDPDVAERARRLRNYGQTSRYVHDEEGFNSRLDELQAAFLRHKLPLLDGWNERRRRLAARYDVGLRGVATPAAAAWAEHVYHLYVVRAAGRDDLQRRLRERGVGTLIHYPIPVHLQAAYRHLGQGPGSLPVTERLASEILSLPMFPELAERDQDTVIATIAELAASPSTA